MKNPKNKAQNEVIEKAETILREIENPAILQYIHTCILTLANWTVQTKQQGKENK